MQNCIIHIKAFRQILLYSIVCLSIYLSIYLFITLSLTDFTLAIIQDSASREYHTIIKVFATMSIISSPLFFQLYVLFVHVILQPQEGAIDQNSTAESPKIDFSTLPWKTDLAV